MSHEMKQAIRVADVDDWIATFGEHEITLIFDQARQEMRDDKHMSFLEAFEAVKKRWSTPTADEVAEDARRNSKKRERAMKQAAQFDNLDDWGRP